MTIRYPAPLQAGDRIGVTAPSSGVEADLRPRLQVAIDHVRTAGFDVVVGECMDGEALISAPADERAAELQAMLLDPAIGAVIPPWGGELAVELLPHLDVAAIAAADPTWLIGWSDISTILLPLTTLSGVATVHGQNLLDTPYRVPEPLTSWLDVITREAGAAVAQGAAPLHRGPDFVDYALHPTVSEYVLDQPGGWRLLDPARGPLQVSGRLIGGCVETVSMLAGTPYGDLAAFAAAHAPEGLILYLEVAGDGAVDAARDLWRMRLAGWFDLASAVLVGRTAAPSQHGFTQDDAVRSAFAGLDVPVVLDVDCGHVPPHMVLVNGALAEVIVDGDTQTITQHLS